MNKLKQLLIFKNFDINVLKVIAIITMTIDHANKICFPENYIFNDQIGRIAMPLFCYMLCYNFLFHSKNPQKYAIRILTVAIISQPFYYYAFGYEFTINILYTLGFGLISLMVFFPLIKKRHLYFYYSISILAVMSVLKTRLMLPFHFSYGFSAFIFMICLTSFLHYKSAEYFIYTMISLYFLNWSEEYYFYLLFTLPLVFCCSFILRGKLDFFKKHKYFFYAFYPGHLFLLSLLALILNT